MSDPDSYPQSDGLGELFENLPTASSSLPERETRDDPAPGSRRALREARRAAEAAHAGGSDTDHATPGPDGTEPSDAPVAETPVRRTPDPVAGQAAASPAREAASAPVPARGATSSPAPGTEQTASWSAVRTAADEEAAGGSGEPGPLDALFAEPHHPGTKAKTKRRGRGCLVALIVVLAVLGAIAAGGAWVYNAYQDKIDEVMGWGEPKDYEPGQASGEALITIKKGDTGSPVSTTLFKAGVTKTDRVFYEYLLKERPTVTFYPGVYRLQKKMTAAAAMEALDDPENRMENTVRVAEGSTVESTLPRIVDGVGIPLEELQAAVADPSAYDVQAENLEGWLFPAVYTFDPGSTATDVIARMVDRTRESLQKAGVPDEDAQRVLTVASIIEREARTPDFAKVSRVIQNRLDDGMMLQMDSTAQYGYGELHAGAASTSKEAQHAENAWNTYVITGLPATPIANPGDAAIDAAMHPAEGPWLYFVTVDMSTGETRFSTTYAEHQRAVDEMRSWCRANPGSGC